MDTIIALATPPGRSAIALIRLSGSDSLLLLRAILLESDYSPTATHASLKSLKDPATGTLIDRALVTLFEAPNSFTGEDVVEISCHGSPVVVRQLLDTLLALGARLAGPGEFSLRALGSGKLNLSQAEAIRDLINAQTDAAANQALRQLGGELSARLQPMKDRLLEIIVLLESAVEFVEDDLPQMQTDRVMATISDLVSEIASMAASFDAGHMLRDGFKVTLVGRPNTGKSSLFNTLLRTDRAIVTDVPGTTRDTLSEVLNIGGLPVVLTDTAGVRDSKNQIEGIGVERTRRAMADADLLLLVLDGSENLEREDYELLRLTSNRKRIIAANKSDLPGFRLVHAAEFSAGAKVIKVSAKDAEGLDDLRAAITEPFLSVTAKDTGLLITDARHHDLLLRAQAELESARSVLAKGSSEELVLVGLHNALRYLGEITSETTAEDVLSRIFSTFCIGK
ncbi:MAG TPA: tRNA uridine-5-carboxymethylaminomethyl(34) synthesis GTPase MnmE [Pyrinomonadaceae bacterium]|jgi:tRNA modification GTPase|nr:tRNA uridine-5-carboxymethylaminomethyl(34) synthesis GTPase MnmE [Pyrinomonadaceae bacterium]